MNTYDKSTWQFCVHVRNPLNAMLHHSYPSYSLLYYFSDFFYLFVLSQRLTILTIFSCFFILSQRSFLTILAIKILKASVLRRFWNYVCFRTNFNQSCLDVIMLPVAFDKLKLLRFCRKNFYFLLNQFWLYYILQYLSLFQLLQMSLGKSREMIILGHFWPILKWGMALSYTKIRA